jgi:hypothetical protein
VARVAVLCPDLLFGSKLEGMLSAAGHQVVPVRSAAEAAGADVLVVDLHEALEPAPGVPSLGFYSHVDQETRRRAEAAGFDRVVPRSRMARDGATLVGALVA